MPNLLFVGTFASFFVILVIFIVVFVVVVSIIGVVGDVGIVQFFTIGLAFLGLFGGPSSKATDFPLKHDDGSD